MVERWNTVQVCPQAVAWLCFRTIPAREIREMCSHTLQMRVAPDFPPGKDWLVLSIANRLSSHNAPLSRRVFRELRGPVLPQERTSWRPENRQP
jgi:hypothetical protein